MKLGSSFRYGMAYKYKEECMDPQPISYHYFYSLCNKWRQEHPPENPKFKLFLELLDISEKGFESDCHDPGYITDMKFTLRSRIDWLEKSQDWLELVRIWDEFKLGPYEQIQQWCAIVIEASIAEGRPSVAARVVATYKLSKDLTNFALGEYARDCESRKQVTEFMIFCRRFGILPEGPHPQFI